MKWKSLKTTANKKILEGADSGDPPRPLIIWKDFVRKREREEKKKGSTRRSMGLKKCCMKPHTSGYKSWNQRFTKPFKAGKVLRDS